LDPVVITYKKAGQIMTRQRKEPRSLASVNRELEQLRAIFNFAHREGWIRLNPFQAGRALISKADEDVRERILSEEEETRLLAACVGPRAHLQAIIICALDTGMRRGEIFRLKWSDVDRQEGIISIRKKTTKTGKARVCGITPRLLAALELQWQMSDQQENSLVFGIASTIKRAWASACHVAEIAGLQFRDLRATANTRMEMANIPESIRMKILGHSQSSTHYRHYLRVNRDLAKSVATIMGNATEERRAIGERIGKREAILPHKARKGTP
jgi:integrase